MRMSCHSGAGVEINVKLPRPTEKPVRPTTKLKRRLKSTNAPSLG